MDGWTEVQVVNPFCKTKSNTWAPTYSLCLHEGFPRLSSVMSNHITHFTTYKTSPVSCNFQVCYILKQLPAKY